MSSALLVSEAAPVAADCPHANQTTTRITSPGRIVIVTRCDDCGKVLHQSSMRGRGAHRWGGGGDCAVSGHEWDIGDAEAREALEKAAEEARRKQAETES